MKKQKNDRALRFYSDVLGLERLHYGLWLPEDELSLEKLKEAQKRYEDYLIENIPKHARRILDVGCGTGVMCARLKELGFDVEGLSPDINEKEPFTRKVNVRFHFCSFEDFSPDDQYDCIIMSESSQYIPLPSLFKIAAQALRKNGYLMICDYLVLNGASGVLSRSGHNYDQLMNEAKSKHFKVISHEDITSNVSKTLDIAKLYIEKVILGLDVATEKIRKRHPYLTHFAFWLFRNKINFYKKEMQLLDSNKFKESKKYCFILLQLDS